MKALRWLGSLALAVAVAAPALADVDARIGGTVRDQSNAFVAGAKVSIRNERTGEQRAAVTNEQGYFLIGALKPSSYTIKAEQTGFAPSSTPR